MVKSFIFQSKLFKKNNTEQKKPDTKTFTPYDSIYIKKSHKHRKLGARQVETFAEIIP